MRASGNLTCCSGQQLPHRGVALARLPRRQVIVAAGRAKEAASQKKRASSETGTRKCPCGSGARYQDCCAPVLGGAWAQSAPELARARWTALILGKPQLLADTTHPEALDAIGNKHSLLKKMEQLLRRRGAASPDEPKPVLADCVHGQSPNDPDDWLVLLAASLGLPGEEQVCVFVEQYRKDAGRWWYFESPPNFPVLEQFNDFLQRYGSGNSEDGNMLGSEPFQGRYEFSWLTVPPRASPPPLSLSPLRRTTAAAAAQQHSQQQLQWLVDEWPAEAAAGAEADAVAAAAAAAARRGRKQVAAAAVPGGWVYLDTAADPETGLTAAQAAAAGKRVFDAASMRDPAVDWDSHYFRHGRFVQ